MRLKKVEEKNKEVTSDTTEVRKYNNLREIMDYSFPFSIFYSGVESETYFKGCYDMGVRDFLMSYHYLQGSKIPLHKRFENFDGIRLFVDSGAYTYQSDPKYLEYSVEDWEKQIKEYLNWARRNKEYIFAIANLDLENLLGNEIVKEWNEKYFEPFMLETGIPVCFIWHYTTGVDMWEKYCERYPYVGFSYVSQEQGELDLSEALSRLKVAEKYNTLVHGMGMTRTSVLPQLPFYTVDSTSWKSGFRYGQVAVWNGEKVQHKKKEEFETKLFPITRTYDLDPPLDEDLISSFYEPEVLRCCVFAYQKAEEYIRERLKPLTYWHKPSINKRTKENLTELKFPDLEWIEKGSQDDWEEYAKEFNISTEDRETAINCIIDLTCFLNWENEEYSDFIKEVYTDKLIGELHDQWVNRIVNSVEDKVMDLKDFFTDCVLGINDKLLLLGTNFDRMVKERESYIEEEEYDYEDATEEELNNALGKYLPAPKEGDSAPEISELDDEIFKKEMIVPIRDEKGRLVKGQKMSLRPKKLYSNKYPKLACDVCVNAQRCPEYKAGYVCAYNKMFERYNTRDMGDIVQAMQGIAEFSLVRLQRGMMRETLNGGMPDVAVSNMMNQTLGILNGLQRLYECGSQEVIRQTKILRADGSQEMTTHVSNPQSGGILEKIFGGMSSSEVKEEVIENNNSES